VRLRQADHDRRPAFSVYPVVQMSRVVGEALYGATDPLWVLSIESLDSFRGTRLIDVSFDWEHETVALGFGIRSVSSSLHLDFPQYLLSFIENLSLTREVHLCESPVVGGESLSVLSIRCGPSLRLSGESDPGGLLGLHQV
jgi:hypothetical protein